jgi:hypothetical protein
VTTPEPDPCQCHQHYASTIPIHEGHCCFRDAAATCHEDEVAAWRAENSRRWVRSVQGGVGRNHG